MLPQPPQDAPSSKAIVRLHNCWRGIWMVWGIAMVSWVTGLLMPMFIKRSDCGRTEVINNAKQLGVALYNFEEDYGKNPDWNTIEIVRKKSGSTLSFGTRTSNDYFRQLHATGSSEGEKIFYANIKGIRKPDNRMDDAHLLEKGECGFTYILGGSYKNVPPRLLLVTPMIPGTDRFDPTPFKGKAVILWTNNSAMMMPIDKHGHVIDSAGRNLFDPSNPVWGGKSPMIAWPDL